MMLSVMIKPCSSMCNMKCEYCFYSSLANERKEANKGFMLFKTAENIIKSALSFCDDGIGIVFQGGEPLIIGIDFYRRFVETEKKLNTKHTPVSYAIQTNGTLINDEWCVFFKKNGFLVGVSLDGDEELNSYRRYPNGSPAFSDIINGISLLKKHGVSFNILSVLTKRTAVNFRTGYRFFRQNGFDYLQYIPYIKPFGSENGKFCMTESDYGDFLNKAFKLYYNDVMSGKNISIRQFDNYRILLKGGCAEQCGMNGSCMLQAVAEGDGSIYPCDFYCTDGCYLGNINESSFKELLNGRREKEFLQNSNKIRTECKECTYFSLCRGGGCKRLCDSFNYCGALKKFFYENEYRFKNLNKRS